MTDGAVCSCITCADEAAEMRVVTVDAARQLALCEAEDGTRRTVEVGLLDDVGPEAILLVHADVAIARLSREAAAR